MNLDQLMFDSGLTDWFNSSDESFTALKSAAGKLAALVAAAERERCAKVCDDKERKKWEILTKGGTLSGFGPRDCSEAIRALP